MSLLPRSLLLNVFFAEECRARPEILPLYGCHVPCGFLGNIQRFSNLTSLDLSFSDIYYHSRWILPAFANVCWDGLRVLKLSNINDNDVGFDFDALSRFRRLQYLDVSYTNIKQQVVVDTCMSNKDLKHLDVSGTHCLSLAHLVPALEGLKTLSYLGVYGAFLGVYENKGESPSVTDVVKMLVDYFSKLQHLTHLDISSLHYGIYPYFGWK